MADTILGYQTADIKSMGDNGWFEYTQGLSTVDNPWYCFRFKHIFKPVTSSGLIDILHNPADADSYYRIARSGDNIGFKFNLSDIWIVVNIASDSTTEYDFIVCYNSSLQMIEFGLFGEVTYPVYIPSVEITDPSGSYIFSTGTGEMWDVSAYTAPDSSGGVGQYMVAATLDGDFTTTEGIITDNSDPYTSFVNSSKIIV